MAVHPANRLLLRNFEKKEALQLTEVLKSPGVLWREDGRILALGRIGRNRRYRQAMGFLPVGNHLLGFGIGRQGIRFEALNAHGDVGIQFERGNQTRNQLFDGHDFSDAQLDNLNQNGSVHGASVCAEGSEKSVRASPSCSTEASKTESQKARMRSSLFRWWSQSPG